LISVLYALAASVSWGISDFLGGLNSRSLAIPAVLLWTQSVGFVLLLPLALAQGSPAWQASTLLFAIGGSLSGLVGIAGLYRGMAIGTISIVAPISATGAAIPVIFGLLARGERASALQSVGVALALVGIVLASLVKSTNGVDKPGRLAAGLGFALLAAFGFGGFFVLLHEAAVQNVFWAACVQRLTGTVVLALVVAIRRPSLRVGWARAPRLVLIGTLDTGANVLYALGSTTGLVSLAAVLASLYPVTTVLLARLVLREELTRVQAAGVMCALAGVACIAAQ
jgi:drug/metabolite transporter (DMT)-like permease